MDYVTSSHRVSHRRACRLIKQSRSTYLYRSVTRPGIWAGFSVGVAAVVGNPKAILFYMGALPGFFDLSRLTAPDITAIILISALVPMAGNLALSLFLDRARQLLSSPQNIHRLNLASGIMLIGVALAIPFL